jgi:hypothetical protein
MTQTPTMTRTPNASLTPTPTITMTPTSSPPTLIQCLNSLNIVVEYNELNTGNGNPCFGGHTCNRAVFTVLANNVTIGTVYLNNIGGIYDQLNVPPGYTSLPPGWTYNSSNIHEYNSSPYSDIDRYNSFTITSQQAINIAASDPSGEVQIAINCNCTAGVNCSSSSCHGSVNFVRVYKDSTLIYAGCPTGNAVKFTPCV